MSLPFRLTNKTALALRQQAKRAKKTYTAVMIALSVVLIALSIGLGLRWLPATPLLLLLTAVLDVLLSQRKRSVYLMLTSQAICTEAAARDIQTGISETHRREQALTDLMRVKADAQRAMNSTQENREARAAGRESAPESNLQHRRRRADGLKLIRGEETK